MATQPPSADGPLDAALLGYILLITILVGFLEARTQQISLIQPQVVIGLGGVVRALDEHEEQEP